MGPAHTWEQAPSARKSPHRKGPDSAADFCPLLRTVPAEIMPCPGCNGAQFSVMTHLIPGYSVVTGKHPVPAF